jgi:hypothetical protein
MTKLQFRVLYRVFLLRVVDLEVLSEQGDSARMLGQVSAVLAGISFVFTVFLIFYGGRFPQDFLWMMEHVLIETTMLVVGLFSVLSWDSTFPDRRDVLVLAPLPIRPRSLFLAKFTALISVLGISIVALNAFSGLLWPLFIFPATSGIIASMRSLAAYWFTVIAASVFIFCSVLGVQWVASQLLPRQLFLRLSAVLQVAIFCLFLSVYILEPSLETMQALTAPENQKTLAWLPSYWFLGLFQQLNGSMKPAFAALAVRAWIGLAVVVTAAGMAYLFTYFSMLRTIVEQPDILPGSRRTPWPLRFGSSLQTAMVLFGLRTLLRSRQHRVILSFYLGVGFALVLACVRPEFEREHFLHGGATAQASLPLLVASILMMGVAVAGVRVVFAMPIALRANWIFRITEIRNVSAYLSAAWRSLAVLALLPVWVGFAVLFLLIWPWRLAAGHLAVLGAVGTILVSACLYSFRKIPFTCSYLPGKAKLHLVFCACVLVPLPLASLGARFEWKALQAPISFALMMALLVVAALVIWSKTLASANTVKALRFEEEEEPEIFRLGLHREGVSPIESSTEQGR